MAVTTTLETVKKRVQIRMADLEDDAYLDDLPFMIAEAMELFASETNCCQKVYDAQISSGSIIDLSSIEKRINYIAAVSDITNGNPVRFSPFAELSGRISLPSTEAAGTPEGYTLWNDTVYFNCPVASSVSYKVFYSYLPDPPLLDSEIVDIPDQFINGICGYVEFLCRNMDREDSLADRAWKLYEAARASAVSLVRAKAGG